MNAKSSSSMADQVIAPANPPASIGVEIIPAKINYIPGEIVKIAVSITSAAHRREGKTPITIIARYNSRKTIIGDITITAGIPNIIEYKIPINRVAQVITIEAISNASRGQSATIEIPIEI